MLFVSVLALSVSHSFDSSPKGGALGKAGRFSVLPKPLPLGEVALRSKDGEGEDAYRFCSRKNSSTCSGAAAQLP